MNVSETLPNFQNFRFDGHAALANVVESSSYRSIVQAVASLAVFTHPDTVRQTMGRNIFSVIRYRNGNVRGSFKELANGSSVMLDDNKAPTDAFVWAHDIRRGAYKDVQFNHLWSDRDEVGSAGLYTSLANILMLPAFLSKLSDTDERVRAILRFRAIELYEEFLTERQPRIQKPENYDQLIWAATLSPVKDLEKVYLDAMRTKPKDRTTCSARKIGWLFSEFKPDSRLA